MTRVAELLNLTYHGCKESEKPELFADVRRWLAEMDHTDTRSNADDLVAQIVAIEGPCDCDSALCKHWQSEAGIILTAAIFHADREFSPAAAMRAAEEIVKLTHSQDIDGGRKRITAEIAAIITRHLPAAPEPKIDLHAKVREAVELERVQKKDADWYRGYNEAIDDALYAIDRTFSAWAPAATTSPETPESLLRDRTRAEQRKAAGDCANCGTPIVEAFATGIGYYWYHVRGLAYCDTDNPSFERTATPAALNQVEGEGK